MIDFLCRGNEFDIGESSNAQGMDGEHLLLNSEWGPQPAGPAPRLEVNALMYFLAYRYDIPEFRFKAMQKIRDGYL